jgi:hypothetical protein
LPNGRLVIVLTVPKGMDKPYFDRNGVIWLKSGADKRRVNLKSAGLFTNGLTSLRSLFKQHFLYFFPLPQGHGSFLPILFKSISSS